MARETSGTDIEPGIVARVASGIRAGVNAMTQAWFGPQQPLQPIVPAEQRESVAGRQFDYPVAYNQRTQARSGEAVSFAEMRQLADSYDLMRLVIESRKDQMAKLKWRVKPKDEGKEADARCEELNAFFAMPDQENPWDSWLRLLLEDLFVIDAPTIYIRHTKGGKIYSLEPVDGATIKRVIDETGRTPIAPQPAYQQILKGIPAIDYTTDELIYRPRNIRTHKVYGYSPVEQVIMTVNIALRRQIHQLQFYTEGSTPDLVFSVPNSWNPDHIAQFKAWWDSQLAGNTGARRGTMFVQDGAKPFDTKAAALKDEYDEWLARIICYAFSVSPQPFIKEVNRATAETSVQQALQEGLAPIQQWVKTLCDGIIVKHFGMPDLEFAWVTEEAIDPLIQAQIHQIYLANKVKTPDEIRADIGLEPLMPEDREAAWPQPEMLGSEDITADDPPETKDKPVVAAEKVTKVKKKPIVIDRERKAVKKAEKAFRAACNKVFPLVAKDVASQLQAMLNKVDRQEIEQRLKELNISGITVLSSAFEEIYAALAKESADLAMVQIGILDDESIVNLVNEKAVKWAKDRAAEMVGKKWGGGELIDNPDARWNIEESTRDLLRETVTTAMEEGWSNDRLADEIQESHAFSDWRSETIARTETAFTDIQGNMLAYRESGLVDRKEWLTADECCDECQDLNGLVVGIDDEFAPGISEAPAHPNCRCDTLPVLTESNDNEEKE